VPEVARLQEEAVEHPKAVSLPEVFSLPEEAVMHSKAVNSQKATVMHFRGGQLPKGGGRTFNGGQLPKGGGGPLKAALGRRFLSPPSGGASYPSGCGPSLKKSMTTRVSKASLKVQLGHVLELLSLTLPGGGHYLCTFYIE
jgi:hypothetical protein